MAKPLEELRKIRLEKLEKIRKLGIEPYPARCQREQTVTQALKMMGKPTAVAGRIMSMRGHGGIQFLTFKTRRAKFN
jgi:lysyl-tRNA synthetase class 2